MGSKVSIQPAADDIALTYQFNLREMSYFPFSSTGREVDGSAIELSAGEYIEPVTSFNIYLKWKA